MMARKVLTRKALRLQKEAFDIAAETDAFSAGHTDVGAIVTFTGLCRDEGGRLAALEIECYAEMAQAEIARIVEEATQRWPLQSVLVVHRYGMIQAGEPIVLVATASRHRTEAFAAAQFLMDYLKTSAPFWKKQHGTDGGVGDWVAPTQNDEEAARKWRS